MWIDRDQGEWDCHRVDAKAGNRSGQGQRTLGVHQQLRAHRLEPRRQEDAELVLPPQRRAQGVRDLPGLLVARRKHHDPRRGVVHAAVREVLLEQPGQRHELAGGVDDRVQMLDAPRKHLAAPHAHQLRRRQHPKAPHLLQVLLRQRRPAQHHLRLDQAEVARQEPPHLLRARAAMSRCQGSFEVQARSLRLQKQAPCRLQTHPGESLETRVHLVHHDRLCKGKQSPNALTNSRRCASRSHQHAPQ